jgi:hypothetical protein
MSRRCQRNARFEFLTAVFLKIQVFCDIGRVLPEILNDCSIFIFRVKQVNRVCVFLGCFTLKIKTVQSLKKWRITVTSQRTCIIMLVQLCHPILFRKTLSDCCVVSSVNLYFYVTDYTLCGCACIYYFRSQDCHELWESSLYLSVNKWVPCSSWLSPWSGQVQRDACWNTRLATLWPHKLSLTVTSWSYCASGNIHTGGWRNKVRCRTLYLPWLYHLVSFTSLSP